MSKCPGMICFSLVTRTSLNSRDGISLSGLVGSHPCSWEGVWMDTIEATMQTTMTSTPTLSGCPVQLSGVPCQVQNHPPCALGARNPTAMSTSLKQCSPFVRNLNVSTYFQASFHCFSIIEGFAFSSKM